MRTADTQALDLDAEGMRELRQLIGQVVIATKQVMQAGNEAQTKAAAEVLTETRRSLYRLLAEE